MLPLSPSTLRLHVPIQLTLDFRQRVSLLAFSLTVKPQCGAGKAEGKSSEQSRSRTYPNFLIASSSTFTSPIHSQQIPHHLKPKMAPAPTTKSNKAPSKGGKSGPSKSVSTSKGGKGSAKPSSAGVKKSKKPQGRVSGEQVKTKNALAHKESNKKKKKVYTAQELGIPELNGIRPEGVTKPPNMKKGKKFVDDDEGMNAIMALVMAEKEGNIESKMQKARHLEELREAKKAEAEKRAKSKKESFEGRKQIIAENEKRKKNGDASAPESRKSMKNGYFKGFGDDEPPKSLDSKKSRKRVSFG